MMHYEGYSMILGHSESDEYHRTNNVFLLKSCSVSDIAKGSGILRLLLLPARDGNIDDRR